MEMEELEKINEEYVNFKSFIEKAKKEIERFDKKINKLKEEKNDLLGKLDGAKKINDLAGIQQYEDEIKNVDDKIGNVKKDVIRKKEEIESLQSKINDRIEKVKENPEMKKHLEKVLTKKYERKLNSLNSEKEVEEKKKERYVELKDLVDNHPTLANNLKGIIKYTKEIKDLEEEYRNANGPDKIAKKALLNEKRKDKKKNKDNLMKYINKHNLSITEVDIEELAQNGIFSIGKDNKEKVNLDLTMNKNLSSIDRKIKGYDKSILNYTGALEHTNINSQTIGSSNNISRNAQTTGAVDNTNIDRQAMGTVDYTNMDGQTNEDSGSVQKETKWYQFIKRFKNWNERRKQKALPSSVEQEQESEQEEEQEEQQEQETRNEFVNSLKYEIVKDIVENKENEGVKIGKEARKQAQQENEGR